MADITFNGTDGPDSLVYSKENEYLVYNVPSSLFDRVFINGLDGDDIITNFSFSDCIINGGAGNDKIFGGLSTDVLVGDDIYGVAGNDYIFGLQDTDALFGLGGNDLLNGGAGTDTLYGGDGNDVFQFDSVSDTQPGLLRDIIKDFVGNGIFLGDQIDLSRIDANTNIAGDQAFTYIGNSGFTAPGQIRYSGDILQGNTDSSLSANFEIQLEGSPVLVASDIIA